MNELTVFQNTNLSKENKQKILIRLKEFHRASGIIGHATSQTSYTLQTLNMISDSPMSRLKQCLAQISNRMGALREAHFKVEKMKLEIIELDKLNTKLSILDATEKDTLIQEIVKNMNHALKEIGMFQDMYDDLLKNNNIPTNWSEKDFESQELENMIRSSYRLAIQDITHSGRCSQAVVEYWEQLGIHPQVGEIETRMYMSSVQEALEKGDIISIKHMYFFLDAMVIKHKDDWKFVLERMGLNCIGSERYMASSVRDINK